VHLVGFIKNKSQNNSLPPSSGLKCEDSSLGGSIFNSFRMGMKILIWPAKGKTGSVFNPWRCWLCVPLKHMYPHVRLHCVTGRKSRP